MIKNLIRKVVGFIVEIFITSLGENRVNSIRREIEEATKQGNKEVLGDVFIKITSRLEKLEQNNAVLKKEHILLYNKNKVLEKTITALLRERRVGDLAKKPPQLEVTELAEISYE